MGGTTISRLFVVIVHLIGSHFDATIDLNAHASNINWILIVVYFEGLTNI
jgi:hypothetical protein